MLEVALEEAERLGDNHIGTEHLLLGALRADDTDSLGDYAMKAFRETGLESDEVRAEVLRLRDQALRSPGRDVVRTALRNSAMCVDNSRLSSLPGLRVTAARSALDARPRQGESRFPG
jgi:hypothetical protein